jgi:hypothetical protein
MTHHFQEDWIVTAYDAEGRLHFVITEYWPEWTDPAYGKASDRALVLYRAMNLDDKEWIES